MMKMTNWLHAFTGSAFLKRRRPRSFVNRERCRVSTFPEMRCCWYRCLVRTEDREYKRKLDDVTGPDIPRGVKLAKTETGKAAPLLLTAPQEFGYLWAQIISLPTAAVRGSVRYSKGRLRSLSCYFTRLLGSSKTDATALFGVGTRLS